MAKNDLTKEEKALPLSDGGQKKKNIPAGLWTKCPGCQQIVFHKSLLENLSVCPTCSYHFVIGALERIKQIIDDGSFKEIEESLESANPLQFTGTKSYEDKIKQDTAKTGLKFACIIGEGKVVGVRVAFGVTDSRFIMGSMGSVVGEKISSIIEYAIKKKLPLVIVSGSGGGARMYEGLFSLMQMAKTSAALAKLKKAGLPFISILTNPTMGGVMASFAALGDIMLAEPNALLGFAGPRVIQQTIKQTLPDFFQTSEFLLEHGMIDRVVERKMLPSVIHNLVGFLQYRKNHG